MDRPDQYQASPQAKENPYEEASEKGRFREKSLGEEQPNLEHNGEKPQETSREGEEGEETERQTKTGRAEYTPSRLRISGKQDKAEHDEAEKRKE